MGHLDSRPASHVPLEYRQLYQLQVPLHLQLQLGDPIMKGPNVWNALLQDQLDSFKGILELPMAGICVNAEQHKSLIRMEISQE